MTHQEWIDAYVARTEDVIQKCREACDEMALIFPELKKVRGHVHFLGEIRIEEWPHWWLITADGDIIDPTASQFPSILRYESWDETSPEPTGKCPNCGEYCYSGRSLCSNNCASEYMAYLNHK